MIVAGKSGLRRVVRAVGRRIPGLRTLSGRLGLGRFLAPQGTLERLILDGDVTIELDLSVPIYRYLYFHHDLANIPELGLIPALLSPDRVFIDVGAHIGYLGLVGAKYAQRAFLYEPGLASFGRMTRNLALNPVLAAKITARRIAISSTSGEMTLYASLAGPDTASLRALSPDAVSELVRVETLDAEIPADSPVGLIKIDVEGAEMDVLDGARRILAQDQPMILIELVEENQRAFGRTCADLVSQLESLGYAGFAVAGDRREPRLAELKRGQPAPGAIINAVFAPRARLESLKRWRN